MRDPATGPASVPPDVLEKLGALGYVSLSGSTLKASGADPKDKIDEYQTLNTLMREGLINLREGQPFTIYGSHRLLGILAANPMFDVLAARLVKRHTLPLGREVALEGAGEELGLTVEAFAVPGKVALYLGAARPGRHGAGPGQGARPARPR